MVSTGFIYFPESKPGVEQDDEDEPQFGETHSLTNEPFYFSYKDIDTIEDLKNNFRTWVN